MTLELVFELLFAAAVVAAAAGFAAAYAERVSGAGPARIANFFAAGMLMNVLSSMGLQEPTEPWAKRLIEGVKQYEC